MEIEQLLLKKEEIPILYETCFAVPIHPILLRNDVSIDERLANNVFQDAAIEWYDDLKEHVEGLDANDPERKYNERVYLNKNLTIKRDQRNQVVDPPGYWKDYVITRENGFASSLMINRNAGGSLYFNPDESSKGLIRREQKFSPEKFLAYRHKECKKDGDGADGILHGYIYLQHNVDFFAGALFLRNWAILYLNAALKQIFKNQV